MLCLQLSLDGIGSLQPMNPRTEMMQRHPELIVELLLLGGGDITEGRDQCGARVVKIEDLEAIQPGHRYATCRVRLKHPQHAVNPSGARSKRLWTAWHSGHSWYFENIIRKFPVR